MYTFDYKRPAAQADATAAFHGDARYLAGGQSLIQAMKLRMSSAETLIDLGGVAGMHGIQVDHGAVVIGAMTKHSEVAASELVRKAIPALADLAGGIGDQMVRNLGTLGGSIANADPAACYPSAIVALGATVHTNQRKIPGADFFTGIYHGGEFSDSDARCLCQVQATRLAFCAGRCVCRADARWRSCGGDGRQGQRVSGHRDRGCLECPLHARGGEGGADADRRYQQ